MQGNEQHFLCLSFPNNDKHRYDLNFRLCWFGSRIQNIYHESGSATKNRLFEQAIKSLRVWLIKVIKPCTCLSADTSRWWASLICFKTRIRDGKKFPTIRAKGHERLMDANNHKYAILVVSIGVLKDTSIYYMATCVMCYVHSKDACRYRGTCFAYISAGVNSRRSTRQGPGYVLYYILHIYIYASVYLYIYMSLCCIRRAL